MPIVYSYDCNKGRRNKNDDAVGVTKNKNGETLAVVCDGVGSHMNASYSSNYVVSSLLTDWKKMSFANFIDIKTWLFDKVEMINLELFNRAKDNNKKMGTTIVVLATHNDEVVVYNVGDSRAYGITKDSQINLVTEDDSFVGELIKAGVITDEEAKTHPEKHILTQAIATRKKINLHTFTGKLDEYNYFLLCSDGLSNILDEQEIKDIVEQEELSVSIKKLIDLTVSRGGVDNISVAILKILRGANDDK